MHYRLEEIKPIVAGVKSCSIYHRVNEITRNCVLVTILRAAEIFSKAYGILR